MIEVCFQLGCDFEQSIDKTACNGKGSFEEGATFKSTQLFDVNGHS